MPFADKPAPPWAKPLEHGPDDLGRYLQGVRQGVAEASKRIFGLDPLPDETADEVGKRAAHLVQALPPLERAKVMRELRQKIHREQVEIRRQEKKRDDTKRVLDAVREMATWCPERLELQRPAGSVAHHLRQAMADGDVVSLARPGSPIRGSSPREYESEVFGDAQFFVVTHDWAAAFKNAGDFAGGADFRLPADVCVFEFKVSGRNVVILATDFNGEACIEMMARGALGWFMFGAIQQFGDMSAITDPEHDSEIGWAVRMQRFLLPQIKAISVALEAEVAEAQVVRAPHKLNRAREKAGRVPANDYHVVELSCRRRVPALPGAAGEYKGIVRLHFRRGHWRHVEDHKTWIKWMLVGNPDLGFVDKEYRL